MNTPIKKLILNNFIAVFSLFFMVPALHAQSVTTETKNILGQSPPSYDALTNIALESPLVADIIVKKVNSLPASQSVGVPANKKRILIIAELQSLIRARKGLNSEIKFLFDAPLDSRGKIPKLKKLRFLAFGSNVKNNADFIKLTHIASMIPYTQNANNALRTIIKDIIAEDAPQKITSISSAFHSPGTIIGEGETQIFLNTETGQPIAISVISKQNQRPKWSASTSEVIDINATEPARNSLLGHRLACGLPNMIDNDKIEAASSKDRRKAATDYDYVRSSIGRCNINIDWN